MTSRTFTLTVDMDSASFDQEPELELGCVLRDIIDRIKDQGAQAFTVKLKESGRRYWAAVDSKGNTVGDFRIVERD